MFNLPSYSTALDYRQRSHVTTIIFLGKNEKKLQKNEKKGRKTAFIR